MWEDPQTLGSGVFQTPSMGLDQPTPELPPAPKRSIMETCSNCGTFCAHEPGVGVATGYSCSECGWTILSKYEKPAAHPTKEDLRIFSSGRSLSSRPQFMYRTEYASDHLQHLTGGGTFAGDFGKPAVGGGMAAALRSMDAVGRARNVALQRRESDQIVSKLARVGISVEPRVVQRALNLPPDRPDEECKLAMTSRPWSGDPNAPRKGARPPPRRAKSAAPKQAAMEEQSKPYVRREPWPPSVPPAGSAVVPQPRREPLSMSRPLQAAQVSRQPTTRTALEVLEAQGGVITSKDARAPNSRPAVVSKQSTLARVAHVRTPESLGHGGWQMWSPQEADPSPPAWSQATCRFGGSERSAALDRFILG